MNVTHVTQTVINQSQQIFAQGTRAQLSGHVQNFVVTASLLSPGKQNQMSIKSELCMKNH